MPASFHALRCCALYASILPPLFRGGYYERYRRAVTGTVGFDLAAPFQRRLSGVSGRNGRPAGLASILPPLFRGGYGISSPKSRTVPSCFDLAAPFQRRLFGFRGCWRGIAAGFDLAAPFQRRLCDGGRAGGAGRDGASILPPLFRGGYVSRLRSINPLAFELRSCRPFSEAVMGECRKEWLLANPGFDLAAPFQRRLCIACGINGGR